MIGYIALCDLKGKISKIIRSVPEDISFVGQDIRELFDDQDACSRLLNEEAVQSGPIRLKLAGKAGREVWAAVKRIGGNVFFLMLGINQAETISGCMELLFAFVDELESASREAYEAGLYEVQRENNQLINYQRDLAKANERLKILLEEAREAKSTIEILERDQLTTLYTLNAFLERSEAMLRRYPEIEFDLIVIDIERFKVLNDTFGTDRGNDLLSELASCILRIQVKEQSLFARAGADKFYALVPREPGLCMKLRQNIDSLEQSYPLPMRIEVKMGIYQIEDRHIGMARMCDRAVLACSSIKGIYNKSLAYYDDSIREKLLMEQKLLDTMVESLERGDFKVYLQPKVEIGSGKVIGAEALARWIHPELGMVSPADFIPLFEKNGFIYSLDLYIWKTTCKISREWKKRYGISLPISVNVSRIDIHHLDLPQTLESMIRSCDLEPTDLHLEITESAYVADIQKVPAVIRELKKVGFIVEMDDFGKGNSSLHTLSGLPADVLKMDLGFLRAGVDQARRQKIMQWVINLAKDLKLQVIAEGTETKEEIDILQKMGCQYAQGYYYGRPMPQDEFLKQIYGITADI